MPSFDLPALALRQRILPGREQAEDGPKASFSDGLHPTLSGYPT